MFMGRGGGSAHWPCPFFRPPLWNGELTPLRTTSETPGHTAMRISRIPEVAFIRSMHQVCLSLVAT